jgi:hypothetical protein
MLVGHFFEAAILIENLRPFCGIARRLHACAGIALRSLDEPRRAH